MAHLKRTSSICHIRGDRCMPPGASIKKLQLKALRTLCSPPHHLPHDQDHLKVILDRMFERSFHPGPYLEELGNYGHPEPMDRNAATALIRELVHDYVTERYARHLYRTGVMSIP